MGACSWGDSTAQIPGARGTSHQLTSWAFPFVDLGGVRGSRFESESESESGSEAEPGPGSRFGGTAAPGSNAASSADPSPARRTKRRRRARAKATQKRRVQRRRAAARLDEALTARGLLRGDLAKSEVTARAYARWRTARSQDDVEAWQRTTDDVVERVRAYPITKAVVDRRLQRVAQRLEAAASVVPPEALRPLEDRYLAVAAEVQPGMTEAAAQRALERATALLVAVNRALPR